MTNQLILIGKIAEDFVLEETESGKKTSTIVLAVGRRNKNDNGEYDTDFIPINLIGNVAEFTKQYCKKGDTIGTKCRVARSKGNDLQIIAEKVTFLSSKLIKPIADEDGQIIIC